ncbi:MAG: glycoside hydrolase family 3 N-terminal domain-containing protein [Patescibacteria group bacterium]
MNSQKWIRSLTRTRIRLLGGVVMGVAVIVGLWLFISRTQLAVPLLKTCKPECAPADAPYRRIDVPVDERIEDLLSHMTEAEKIGQLALVEKNSVHDLNDITSYGLGGMLSGGGGYPTPNTPASWLEMVRSFQARAQATRLGIPLLYGVDAIHGHANVIGATVFPHAIGLGASQDPDLVYRVAQATTEEMLATGIHWNFGPDINVVQDTRWGRVYETFGSSTDLVTSLGRAYVEGMQATSSMDARAIVTMKAYLGAGAMVWGSATNEDYKIDQGTTTEDETTMRRVELPPFQAAIEAGAPVVLVGLNSWKGAKLSTNHHLLTDVLKEELGFRGMVVSDWYGVYMIPGGEYHAVVTAINAGVDMVMLPFDYKSFVGYVGRALKSGDISSARLDDAVRRILRAKFAAGLFEQPTADGSSLASVGSDAHRAIAREAVRKSLVQLQNKNKTLPLSPNINRIIVAGSVASNLGRQMGGWTVEWQGIEGNWVPGTTILDGIKAAVSSSTTVDYSLDGSFGIVSSKANIGIAVVGETPYAEGVGDNAHPSLSATDLATIDRVRAVSQRLVVVIVSGRPLELPPESNKWDAIVAAWLPGSEGEGIADVLFGSYPFTGTLPLAWPR